ncbi:MAG: SAM hydrolase/SAM-dependent halogenase family protein, partial [Thermodesulfobacteriota bacterium]
AGFFLSSTWSYLPEGSICLAVVDPGVGTDRRILLLEAEGKYVLVPDNGLISLLLEQLGGYSIYSVFYSQLEEWVSSTFHGRDVFAPAAAKLASGVGMRELGESISREQIARLYSMQPQQTDSGVFATVLHIDQFGNCITNLSSEKWSIRVKKAEALQLPDREFPLHPVGAYEQIPESSIGILQSSQGYLELAKNRASCAKSLALDIGDSLSIQLRD